MINSNIRLANGIMRFARYWAYEVVAKARRLRTAAKGDRINKFYVEDENGNPVRSYGRDKWDNESELRMEEIYRNVRKNDVTKSQLMERMLRPIVPEIYNVAVNIDMGLQDYAEKVEKDSLTPEDQARIEKRFQRGLGKREQVYNNQKNFVEAIKKKYESAQKKYDDNHANLLKAQKDSKDLEDEMASLQDEINALAEKGEDTEKKQDALDYKADTLVDLDNQIDLYQRAEGGLLEAADELRKEYEKALKDLKSDEETLESYKSTKGLNSNQVQKRAEAFHKFVSDAMKAQTTIFDYLMEYKDEILGSFNMSQANVKSDPEEIAANMAANLWYALNGLKDGASKVMHGMSSDMDMLGTTERGVHAEFASVSAFLRMCKKWMSDAMRRSTYFLMKEQNFPTVKDDDGNDVSLEDRINEAYLGGSGKHMDPSNFEDKHLQDAIMDLGGSGGGLAKKIRSAMIYQASQVFANNPLELAAFKQWMANANSLKEVAQDIVEGNERTFELSADFYKSLWEQAKTDPQMLDAVRQNRLTSQDRAVLQQGYAAIQQFGSDELKARVIEVNGQTILLKSMTALKELFSRVIIPNVLKETAAIIQSALANTKSYGGILAKLAESLTPEALMAGLSKMFSRGSKSRKSSIDIGAELLRVAELLRDVD